MISQILLLNINNKKNRFSAYPFVHTLSSSKRSCKAENNNKNIPKTRLSKKTLKRFYQYLMSQQLSTYIDLHYYYKNKGIKYENKNICK